MARLNQALLLAVATVVLASCVRERPRAPVAEPQEHLLTGDVLTVTPERQTVLVHHDEIAGYMPAMTMEFLVAPADLKGLKEGQRIRARMFPDAKDNPHLDHIAVVDPVREREIEVAAKALRQDTIIRGQGAYREIGETVPSFTLYNQDGVPVSIEHFRGKRVVLNFIFTRCPVPTMCPLSTAKMMALQAAARNAGVRDLELVSISFDSAYDTPPVLKAYAAARNIDTTNFSFLTGPESSIRDLLVQFGIIVERSENVFKHTLSTVLIGRDGKIVHRVEGSTWQPEDFLKRL
jgi:protein SCO1/2